jgi:hypothetical protein
MKANVRRYLILILLAFFSKNALSETCFHEAFAANGLKSMQVKALFLEALQIASVHKDTSDAELAGIFGQPYAGVGSNFVRFKLQNSVFSGVDIHRKSVSEKKLEVVFSMEGSCELSDVEAELSEFLYSKVKLVKLRRDAHHGETTTLYDLQDFANNKIANLSIESIVHPHKVTANRFGLSSKNFSEIVGGVFFW